jgi:uncharacterized protein YyaL (SSP411 family)
MPNRLADATSPYLRQHAANPVDWQPWDAAALAQARRENKPILLSVGYSACHWCHVMAHESFEDAEVARVMNDLYVNIKVDREERPDLDQIYQSAHALLTRQSGGWPLTMFLTPDGAPFFGGTYYPKESRYGRPGFLDLLPRLAVAYREQGPAIAEQNVRLREAMASLEPAGGAPWPKDAPGAVLSELKRTFDPVDGGFGAAPKFPHAAELDFALAAHARDGDVEALAVARTTLARMADGGIHDQLAGGFCRYSVDAQWTIPHFEKMLYDNGPLLGLYADLARVTGERAYADVAHGIVGWMVREMRAPDGAFYASLDADSEGEEGRFYVWQADEVRALLNANEWAIVAPHYGLDQGPNFEGTAWHLRVTRPLAEVAARAAVAPGEAARWLASARSKLAAARARRVRPARDDKILTAWNALAIGGLARGARALNEAAWIDLACAAVDALKATVWREGRLFATRGEGAAALNAYLDDHAFLLAALIELLQARFRRADYDWACALADALLARFEDGAAGGFWFTSHDHEALFHRHKPGHDNATPSGNGIAAQALHALGHLTGEMRYVEAAERTVIAFARALAAAPQGYTTLAGALGQLQVPPTLVVLDGEASVTGNWRRHLARTLRPGTVCIDLAGVAEVPASLRKGPPPASGAAAWVCRGATCLPPVSSVDALAREVG